MIDRWQINDRQADSHVYLTGLAAYIFIWKVITQPEISPLGSAFSWMTSQPPITTLSSMQHHHHLGNGKKYKFSGITQNQLNQKLWQWVLAIGFITSPPGDSDERQSLKTTGLEYNITAFPRQIILTFRVERNHSNTVLSFPKHGTQCHRSQV